MTPELHSLVRERARSLQIRLNRGVVSPVIAATEAHRLFVDVSDAVRVRWLNLELNSYRTVAGSSLSQVLADGAGGRLTAHIIAYRTQIGSVAGRPFSYFFVESLPELMSAQVEAVRLGNPRVQLQFAPRAGGLSPFEATFGSQTFDRILGGFLAALHLQLSALAR